MFKLELYLEAGHQEYVVWASMLLPLVQCLQWHVAEGTLYSFTITLPMLGRNDTGPSKWWEPLVMTWDCRKAPETAIQELYEAWRGASCLS